MSENQKKLKKIIKSLNKDFLINIFNIIIEKHPDIKYSKTKNEILFNMKDLSKNTITYLINIIETEQNRIELVNDELSKRKENDKKLIKSLGNKGLDDDIDYLQIINRANII